MKKLTKALNTLLKGLEVKSIEQLRLMETAKLQQHLSELKSCKAYDLTTDQKEMVEALEIDIDGILKDRLADSILTVADKKEAPKKDTKKTTKKEAPKKEAPKKEAKKEAPKKDIKKEAPAPADNKKKAPAKKEAPKKTVYDLIQWKSIIEMNDNEGSIYNVYVVDIHPNKKDCICRGFDDQLQVFQFLEDELKKGVYTDTNNISWTLTVKGKAE